MTIVTCFNFAEAFCFATGWPGASGDLEKWDDIQYLDDNDLCIDHLHTEAEVIVEHMRSFEEDGALLITVATGWPGASGDLEKWDDDISMELVEECVKRRLGRTTTCIKLPSDQ